MTARELAQNVLRHELKANEELEELVEENDWGDAEEALLSVGAELVDNAENEQRTKTILVILFQIGQGTESERIVSFAKDHLEEWRDKYE